MLFVLLFPKIQNRAIVRYCVYLLEGIFNQHGKYIDI